MKTGGEQGGVTEKAPEDIEKDYIEHVTCPTTSYGLPSLPSNF